MFTQKTEAEHFASLLKSIVLEGGKMARAMRSTAAVEEKADKTLVTAADLAVTDLVKNRLEPLLKQDNHTLIDEESINELPSIAEAFMSEYQWVLDPVDGTSPYSVGLPFYAVSLGLLKNGEPWLGAAYLPDMDELFWTDGKGNVMHQVTVCGAGKTSILQKEAAPVYDDTPIFHVVNDKDYQCTGYHVDTGASVVNGVLAINSNVAGIIDQAKIWDLAAVMAMYKTLGFKLENAHSRTEFIKFGTETLEANWRLKEPCIAAFPENITFMYSKFKNLHAEKAA